MPNEISSPMQCLNCNRPETIIPLLGLRYAGRQNWICSQCLPLLIHHPDQLAHRLAEAGQSALDPHLTPPKA